VGSSPTLTTNSRTVIRSKVSRLQAFGKRDERLIRKLLSSNPVLTTKKIKVMKEEIVCPNCGEKENFHFNYDYTQKHMPIINVMCNECGEFFEIKE